MDSSEMIVEDKVVAKPKRGRRSKKEMEQAALAAAEAAAALQNDPYNTTKTPSAIGSGVQSLNLGSLQNEVNTTNNIKLNIINDKIEEKEVEVEMETGQNAVGEENTVIKATARKRGRKPKGGKIVLLSNAVQAQVEARPNVILHLKCSTKDLLSTGYHDSNFSTSNIESFHFHKNELSYEIIASNINNMSMDDPTEEVTETAENYVVEKVNPVYCSEVSDTRDVWKKLKVSAPNLHMNNISDKKSACFWCAHDFDNPPIYIPKHFIKDSYHVYGCFCTPECAVAHLMEENIDSSIKFERYHLINHIYAKIYEYKKNIKPAPNPHYMLEKFYGNLTIQEYRALLNSERLFLIVDKPLTRILPEFHEDNDDFIINNKIIPSNNYQVKKKNGIQQKKVQTKTTIMSEKFGFNTTSSYN